MSVISCLSVIKSISFSKLKSEQIFSKKSGSLSKAIVCGRDFNFRKLKSRPQTIAFESDPDFLENICSDFNLEKEIDLITDKQLITDILNSLDYKYKEILELKFLEEKDYREISDILKKPLGTIATLINRAKKQFKKELIKQNIKLK